MKTPSEPARRAAIRIHALFERALATTEGGRGIEAPDSEELLRYADERWECIRSPETAQEVCSATVFHQSTLDEIAAVIDEVMK